MAGRVHQPVLSVLGSESPSVYREARDLLHQWLPQTQDLDIDGANHLLQYHSPRSAALVAEGIASFLARHPMGSPATQISEEA